MKITDQMTILRETIKTLPENDQRLVAAMIEDIKAIVKVNQPLGAIAVGMVTLSIAAQES